VLLFLLFRSFAVAEETSEISSSLDARVDESAEHEKTDVRDAAEDLIENVSPFGHEESKKNVFAFRGSEATCREDGDEDVDVGEEESHPRHAENRPKNVDAVCA
jgi:hypothetical protein